MSGRLSLDLYWRDWINAWGDRPPVRRSRKRRTDRTRTVGPTLKIRRCLYDNDS
jgi:hypothetical protein